METIKRITCPYCGQEHLLYIKYTKDKTVISAEFEFSCKECKKSLSFEIKNAKDLIVTDALGSIIKIEKI